MDEPTPASLAERIAQRMAQALMAATPAGRSVWRDRDIAFERSELPAVLVECLDETTEPVGGAGAGGGGGPGAELNVLRVAVTVLVRSAQWQSGADALRVAAHRALMADRGLAALVAQVQRERCEWRSADADVPLAGVTQVYALRYLAARGCLDAAPR